MQHVADLLDVEVYLLDQGLQPGVFHLPAQPCVEVDRDLDPDRGFGPALFVGRVDGSRRQDPDPPPRRVRDVDLDRVREWLPKLQFFRADASDPSYGVTPLQFATTPDSVWRNRAEFLKGRDGKFTWRNRIPGAIGEIFERHGFIWGAKWYHMDSMHFEYRPELIALAKQGWPTK